MTLLVVAKQHANDVLGHHHRSHGERRAGPGCQQVLDFGPRRHPVEKCLRPQGTRRRATTSWDRRMRDFETILTSETPDCEPMRGRRDAAMAFKDTLLRVVRADIADVLFHGVWLMMTTCALLRWTMAGG